MSTPKLFQPTLVGDIELSHRIVFAPTTLLRTNKNHAPLPHVAEYYEQRANMSGSLLIAEATYIAARAGGFAHVPGIWSDEQIAAWKKVTKVVHAKGSYIYLQLWALGRAAKEPILAEEGFPDGYVSASDVPISGRKPPRPLTFDGIHEYVQLYATAASNAVHKAGFDGVEVHSANGYLLDQFLHDRSNIRTDAVVEAVVKAVGQKKTGFRISPWGTFQDMHFDHPKPTFSYLVTQLRDRYPELVYLHVVEPRVDGNSNDFICDIWGDRRLISAGGYTPETAFAVAENKGDLIAFSCSFITNPDLLYRLLRGITLAVGDRKLYYAPGSADPKGYTDYQFAAQVVKAH
ncbi:NADH:flavin oxidoreductase/NADH oxidase [Mycena capillaripes]|nr:NADH:flavin oxidoreductase/NADH oxidase [Mycena capillaripes]